MRFILDENVPVSARKVLEAKGHKVELIVDHAERGAIDPVVATVSERLDAILISFDGDFEKIAPRIPEGERRRYRRLSRIRMMCPEYDTGRRLDAVLSLIESEYEIAQASDDIRMLIWLSKGYIKIHR